MNLRRRFAFPIVFALLSTASSGVADPAITSVTPNVGPATGGTRVVIEGREFSQCFCSPPVWDLLVYFGDTLAETEYFNDTRLEAIAPLHLPGTVSVTVVQNKLITVAPNAFTFTGQIEEDFDPILLPIFTPPVFGAFGSEFHTDARIWNQGTSTFDIVGVDSTCIPHDLFDYPDARHSLEANGDELFPPTTCSTSTGRLFYVPKGNGTSLAASLRVRDVSRQAESHGVEIPVVRLEDFRTDRISLLGVPVDDRFRSRLRIYGLDGGVVTVKIGDQIRHVALLPGKNAYEPWYGELSEFPSANDLPQGQSTVRVTVDAPNTEPASRIWAMISVTNNVTQEITIISPN